MEYIFPRFHPGAPARPEWARVSLSPEERSALHEDWVEIINEIRRQENWYARVQPALDRLK